MRIVFLGPPGAGKGTQSQRLASDRNLVHLSTGELLREARDEHTELGELVDEYLDAGRLVPDKLVIDLVDERISQPDCADGVIFDGFPRTLRQAEELDRLLADRGEKLDFVAEFMLEEGELLKRLVARGRGDDTMAAIRQRLQSYQNDTKPLDEYYLEHGLLHRIDAHGSPEEIYARLLEHVESVENSTTK